MLAEPAAYTVDTTKLFMKEISRYKLITVKEETKLAAEISQGSEIAREKLITANLRLVIKIAHDYKGYAPIDELISYGILGLMRGAEKFDPSFGSKFSSYAAWWIKQGMRRSISENKLVRIPVSTAAKVAKIQMAIKELSLILSRLPTDKEISNIVGFSENNVKKLKYTGNITESLDAPIGDENDSDDGFNFITDEDLQLPVDSMIKREFHECLDNLIEKLKPREKNIIILRFGLRGREPQTLHQISAIISRSRERVRQIERDALKQLKQWYIEMN